MEINEGRASYDMDKLFQTMNNYVDDKLDQSPLRKYDHYNTHQRDSNMLSKSTNYPIDKDVEHAKF